MKSMKAQDANSQLEEDTRKRQREAESRNNPCMTFFVKFIMKGGMLILAVGLISFFSYAYISWFILPYLLKERPEINDGNMKKKRKTGASLLALHFFFLFMILWSLIKTWWQNPGYVKDYFKSTIVYQKAHSTRQVYNDSGENADELIKNYADSTRTVGSFQTEGSHGINSEDQVHVGRWRIQYVTRIYHVFDRSEYDTIKTTTVVEEDYSTDAESRLNERLLGVEPLARVRLQISERYQVDEEGREVPYSRCALSLSGVPREGNVKRTAEEFYQFKYCQLCDELKPPRSHHCSACDCCVMKMDHHCPWVGNCVGLLTHKFFWLFLFYAALGLIQVSSSTYFIMKDQQKEKFSSQIDLLIVLSTAVSFSVSVLLGMHTYLLMKNWTTIESFALAQNDLFSSQRIGESWEQAFGLNKWLWLVPVAGPRPKIGLDYAAKIAVAGSLPIRFDTDVESY